MKIKPIIISAILLLISSGYTIPAHALCTQIGVIVAVETDVSDPDGPTSVFALRNRATSSFLWVGLIADESTRNLAAQMMTTQRQVEITGAADTCPASGTARNTGVLLVLRAV
jgi:hypothetical protein